MSASAETLRTFSFGSRTFVNLDSGKNAFSYVLGCLLSLA